MPRHLSGRSLKERCLQTCREKVRGATVLGPAGAAAVAGLEGVSGGAAAGPPVSCHTCKVLGTCFLSELCPLLLCRATREQRRWGGR